HYICAASHIPLCSFPTRRSSDLQQRCLRCNVHELSKDGGNSRFPSEDELGGSAQKIGLLVEQIKVTCGLCHKSFRLGACPLRAQDRKSTRLNSSHLGISYAVFCL